MKLTAYPDTYDMEQELAEMWREVSEVELIKALASDPWAQMERDYEGNYGHLAVIRIARCSTKVFEVPQEGQWIRH